MARPTLSLLCFVSLLACGAEPPPLVGATQEALPAGAESVAGIAMDEDGRLFALIDDALFERAGEGAWSRVWTNTTSAPLLDIASLGAGRFALTTTNMGYELDLATGQLEEHFCYEPGEEIREEPVPNQPAPTTERSLSVAYDRDSGLIFANPQTLTDAFVPVFSEIASFDRLSGEELVFRSIGEPEYAAHGLAVLDFPLLLAGRGDELSTIDFNTGERRVLSHVEGVGSIEGLVIDQPGQRVALVDGTSMTLRWIAFASLGL